MYFWKLFVQILYCTSLWKLYIHRQDSGNRNSNKDQCLISCNSLAMNATCGTLVTVDLAAASCGGVVLDCNTRFPPHTAVFECTWSIVRIKCGRKRIPPSLTILPTKCPLCFMLCNPSALMYHLNTQYSCCYHVREKQSQLLEWNKL